MTMISKTSMIRGADGRLYAVAPHSVSEVAEVGAQPSRKAVRAGSRDGYDTADQEAGRYNISPAE